MRSLRFILPRRVFCSHCVSFVSLGSGAVLPFVFRPVDLRTYSVRSLRFILPSRRVLHCGIMLHTYRTSCIIRLLFELQSLNTSAFLSCTTQMAFVPCVLLHLSAFVACRTRVCAYLAFGRFHVSVSSSLYMCHVSMSSAVSSDLMRADFGLSCAQTSDSHVTTQCMPLGL